ncbi:MAG: hypothetical protein VX185_12800 [Pseudomonadota bacterium]|nr:hypothetical protein [Pseudomonadota bacterium]
MKTITEKQLAYWLTERLHENHELMHYAVTACTFALNEDFTTSFVSCEVRANAGDPDNEDVQARIDELVKEAKHLFEFEINREHS